MLSILKREADNIQKHRDDVGPKEIGSLGINRNPRDQKYLNRIKEAFG